ncbi:MAG: hypothetical protein KC729_08175, partial [Candidatus Eisenbacteria bacterium]|nr:hypothetical protein [Candidatus Eisenbacteria bacterium]
SDASGLVDVGDLNLLLDDPEDIVSVLESMKRITDFKLDLVNTRISSPDQLWATPGGDFIEAASASVATTGVGSYSVQSEGLRADVQAWADEPTDALGWIILGDETEPTTARRIDSRENEEPANRPTLTIFFSRVDPVLSSSWGEIKLRFGR